MTAPMMGCGHAANAQRPDGSPACVICAGIDPGADVIAPDPPSLEGRTARCGYYGNIPTGRNHESNYGCSRGEPCECERPSSPNLPFFEHRPDATRDSFYCGCWGFD